VLDALAPHARSGISASEIPFALKLPNLWHLATNIEGVLSDGSSALDLAAALHPTAAVAGTPTAKALEVIRELEPLDRGRYGGPVGWVDAAGDGKWAVSLRSAEVSPEGDIRAYAGGGILAASDPDVELAETKLKFRPIVEAFG
jgi:menaquinone-specific isochorismate synthase